MYMPAGHSICRDAVQASVAVLVCDIKALKNPGEQSSHLGRAVALPAVFVYFPAGHLVCAIH